MSEPPVPGRSDAVAMSANPLLKSRVKKKDKAKDDANLRSNVVFKGEITGAGLAKPIGVRGRLWLTTDDTIHGEYSTQKSDGTWWKEPYQLRGKLDAEAADAAAPAAAAEDDAPAAEATAEEPTPAADAAAAVDADAGADDADATADADADVAAPEEGDASAAPAPPAVPAPPTAPPPSKPPAPPAMKMLSGRVKSINEAGEVLSTLTCTFPENLVGSLRFEGANANGAARHWEIVSKPADWKVAAKPRIFYFDVKGAKVNRVSRQPGKLYACLNFMGIQRGTSNVKKATAVRWDTVNESVDAADELHHKFVFKVPNVETCPDLILNIALYKTKPIQMQADKMIGSFRLKFSKAMVVNQLVDRWYVLTEKPSREKVGQMQLAVVVVDANEIELPDSPTEALVIDKIESSFLRSYGQLEAPTAGKEPSKMSKSGGVLAALTGSHGQLYAQSKSKLGGRGSLVGGPSDGAPPAAPAAGEDAGADGAPEGGRKKKKRVLGRVANKRAKEKRMADAAADEEAERERARIARDGEAFVNPLDMYDFGSALEATSDAPAAAAAAPAAESEKKVVKKASWMKHRKGAGGGGDGDAAADAAATSSSERRASAVKSKRAERMARLRRAKADDVFAC